ncbi:uncharacterized protein LOC108909389 [Anoplophora glabripennis]|uniref:uncharacterized protein LOC108909389 n=1 Tax=Anoplophora glabripennis TaxID=217634 RepID=UPI00087466F2|nr:uncharacterized protein LOC108909389 [Anoplophora glabripennis]
MKVLPSLILLVLVNYAYAADTTKVGSCHDVLLPEVTMIVDNTICTEGPCVMSPGSDVSILVSFDTPVKLEHIKPKLIATVGDVELEVSLGQDDACEGIVNTKCPVAAGEHVDYEHEQVLSDIYPEGVATLTSVLLDLDNDGAEVICYTIDVLIEKS